MPKAQRQAAASEVRSLPQVGDKVCPPRSEVVYEVSKVHVGGDEVDLHLPGTNLERFRVRTDALTYVERKPPASTSNPFNPEPVFDARGMVKSKATITEDTRLGPRLSWLPAQFQVAPLALPQ